MGIGPGEGVGALSVDQAREKASEGLVDVSRDTLGAHSVESHF